MKRSRLSTALAWGLTSAAVLTAVSLWWSVTATAWWTPIPFALIVAIGVRAGSHNSQQWVFRAVALGLSYLAFCALHFPGSLEKASTEVGGGLSLLLAAGIAIAHPVGDAADGLWWQLAGTLVGCTVAWRIAAPYPRAWGPPALRGTFGNEEPPPSSRGEYAEIVAAALFAAESETHHSRPTPPEGWKASPTLDPKD